MTKSRFDDLLARVDDLHRMSELEARDFVKEVYRDGIVSRQEADVLFNLNEQIGGTDPVWDKRFREAVKDFLLTVEPPIGWIDDAECEWLVERISKFDPEISAAYVELLLDVLQYAEGAPKLLGTFTITVICDAARREKKISETTVELLRRALAAPVGDDVTWVTRREANLLLKLNDTCAFAGNDKSWNDLFARALGNYLLAAAHPDPRSEAKALSRHTWLQDELKGVAEGFSSAMLSMTDARWFDNVTQNEGRAEAARLAARESAMRQAGRPSTQETNWLLQRLGGEKSLSPAERALVSFLDCEVPGFVSGLAAA
ncbi:MAG: hypothetical protein AAGF33_01035 [Pseudomonadota bacterium]